MVCRLFKGWAAAGRCRIGEHLKSCALAASPSHLAGTFNAPRQLGRFQLHRSLGLSARTLLWLATDPLDGRTLVLAMPRRKPADAAALHRWLAAAHQVGRIQHPGLAAVVEFGDHGAWPYLAYDGGSALTMADRLNSQALPWTELMRSAMEVLRALAFAHEAGMAHGDLQASMCLLQQDGSSRLIGLGAVLSPQEMAPQDLSPQDRLPSVQVQRQEAERDLLAFGLVLHHALAGQPALGLPDVGAVIDRMPPRGRDSVRLPLSTPRPIPEALRLIVNRATERQPRQRYRSARTLEGAIDGWSRSVANSGGEPIGLLLDRIRVSGVLPAMPGGAARAARIALMDRESTHALADRVRQDLGLSLALLRSANSPDLQGALPDGRGAILTLRRAITVVGLDGLHLAAMALRVWPGPLNEHQAGDLAQLIARVQHAGRAAQSLRPAGYDAELAALLAMLQNLGRLALRYHFPEEAAQIRRLMQPAPPLVADQPEQTGMSEESACQAVLGVDVDALGMAVGRYCGFDDQALWMMRRLPPSVSSHFTDIDQDLLRLTASCANELVDAWSLPALQRPAGLQRLVDRYGRALGVSLRDLVATAEESAHERSAPADVKSDVTADITADITSGSWPISTNKRL